MDDARILVTGASGNVGREVVRALLARGARVRVTSSRTARLSADGATETARLDFHDRSTFAPAVEGCGALFLLRPPAVSDVRATLNPFVDAARAGGVGHVVFLSVAGAGENALVPHHAVEQHLIDRAGSWTILRPGFFAQNLADAYLRDVRDDARIYVPAGRARVAFVDLRDVGDVAALALTEPARHRGEAYTLTGPEAVTFDEVAGNLTAALGRRVRYVPASVAGYSLHLLRRGLPLAQVAVQTVLHVGLRFGQARSVDPTLARLLGRPGRTMKEYVFDHVEVWKRPPPSTPNVKPLV
jgi:uncharacterized protein YbjT (DUF2867 family)